ncbi:Gfo/Idh/MocA family oxidoreductase [Rhodobacter sp. KR11]|uniref:Gfo/Idh/MocA family protein n=1 Tax=Rhodobacter sp. KR11 TaxID=2974588 RepID=UPI002222E1B1|nr:Gfo/Idh/MocA family oxidoreductase [Rhodobacter sp. KR11]MCW1920776.1 Gfo/Idh/MocA family oxidoreductase [Rhodobacter sp. KR11]
MPQTAQTDKTRIAVVGLGKMGLSHFAMVNAHPQVTAMACDAGGFLTDVLEKNIKAPVFRDYDAMLDAQALDAVLIATPSRLHGPMVRKALERGCHVFCEKPFTLDWKLSEELADLAEAKGLVNRVGYHYRHVGAFGEVARLLAAGAIGQVTHILAEAYGPVVLAPKRSTWRSQKAEGGGCLYDYAAHPLNLLNWYFGTPVAVSGSVLAPIFSTDVDDQVMSTLRFANGATAQLSVNWSDDSQRKMTTRITLIGTNGRIFADRQEAQIYLRKPVAALPDIPQGHSVKYTTELTQDPWFYLRGEEYSHQIGDFVDAIRGAPNPGAVPNDFRSGAATDRTIAMILEDQAGAGTAMAPPPRPEAPKKRRFFGLL